MPRALGSEDKKQGRGEGARGDASNTEERSRCSRTYRGYSERVHCCKDSWERDRKNNLAETKPFIRQQTAGHLGHFGHVRRGDMLKKRRSPF